MTRYIAFSLYGSAPLYITGMLRNIRLAPRIYPGWTVVIYLSPSARAALEALRPWQAPATLIDRPEPVGHEGMFWRFQALELPDAELAIFRDSDSRLNVRERAAVDEWIRDKSAAHIMRDHEAHIGWPIQGGMWGLRANAVPDLSTLMEPFRTRTHKLADMEFLRDELWPRVQTSVTHHASVASPYPRARPFPKHAPYTGFVGEVVPPDR